MGLFVVPFVSSVGVVRGFSKAGPVLRAVRSSSSRSGFFFFLIVAFFAFRMVFWGWGLEARLLLSRRMGSAYGDALEILNQRYARGEITKEQYDQMKRDIQQHP